MVLRSMDGLHLYLCARDLGLLVHDEQKLSQTFEDHVVDLFYERLRSQVLVKKDEGWLDAAVEGVYAGRGGVVED